MTRVKKNPRQRGSYHHTDNIGASHDVGIILLQVGFDKVNGLS